MVTLEVIMEVIIPMLMARLIDYGIQAQNLGYIWKMGILLAVTAMISLMFGVLSGKFAARASAGFAKNLRKDMYYNVQNFSFSNIDKFSTASIVTRLRRFCQFDRSILSVYLWSKEEYGRCYP